MESPALRIRLFGALEIRQGDTLLPALDSARAESLLAYLLLHRDAPQPRQRLAFLLWPDTTEAQARTNLRHLLHTLRHALPDIDRFLDVTPRVVPMQFHWTGKDVVVTCWPDDPKAAAIRSHCQVALTIDTVEPPFKVLQIRGTAAVGLVDGVPPELVAASVRNMGLEAGQAFADQAAHLSPQIVSIAVRPTWVDVLDFETRLPGGMVRWLADAAR